MNAVQKILKNKLLLRTVKLSGVSVFANFLGFLIPIYIAYNYTISKKTDDFFLSYSIILFISTMFAGSVRTVIIPFLVERLKSMESYNEFISSVFHYSSKYLIYICLACFAVTGGIYFFTHNQLYWYLFLSVPIIYFSVINSLFYGILNSLDQFYVAEMSPISRAIIIFAMIYLFNGIFGISAVIIGYNLGELGKFFHLLYIIKYKNKLVISKKLYNTSSISSFLKQGFYQIVSVTLSASAPMVDRVVASFLAIGAVSMLDYGDKIFSVFIVILGAFLTLILSKWSSDAVNGNFKIAKLHKIMGMMFIASTVVFIVTWVFKINIINIIYPKVAPQRRELIAYMLVINMAGFILNSLNQVINRAIIVMKYTSIMITTSIFRVVTNFVFDIICAMIWGVVGIVYASVMMQLVGLLANYYLYRKYYVRETKSRTTELDSSTIAAVN